MNLSKTHIDPDKIFYVNEKKVKIRNSVECKLCGNNILTEENYKPYNGLIKECPYCSGFFPRLEEELIL
jgi:hypothetical protein